MQFHYLISAAISLIFILVLWTLKLDGGLNANKYCKERSNVLYSANRLLHLPKSFDPRNPEFSNTPIHVTRPKHAFNLEEPAQATFKPLVTVVIPFFNTGSIFFDTLLSVLKQSLQQIEIIIVNDASRSNVSTAILDEFRHPNKANSYSMYDPRIRVIDHQVNMGPGETRNTGWRAARADYIFFVDSDDLLEPLTIEKLYLHLLSIHQQERYEKKNMQVHTKPGRPGAPSDVHIGFAKGWSVGFGNSQYLWPKGFDSGADFLKENLVTVTTLFEKKTLELVDGFNSEMVHGLEDWDFWLKCANHNIWGSTVPEYLDWYYRKTKEESQEAWKNWGKSSDELMFQKKYPNLYHKFPQHSRPTLSFYLNFFTNVGPKVSTEQFLQNANVQARDPSKPRILMIVPWLVLGGADKFNLNLMKQLYYRNWEITIVSTVDSENAWFPDFQKYSPDVWMLPQLFDITDFPFVINYLIQSRRPDIVLLSNSEFGYQILPFLKHLNPGTVFVDYNHMEQIDWKNGGYPRYGIGLHDLLDMNIVSSKFLKEWMLQRKTPSNDSLVEVAERVKVCYVNVDTEEFQGDPITRQRIRQIYHIPDDAIVIMYAARFVEQKQPKVMAQVFKKLAAKGYPFYALIAGYGPEKPWVDQFVENDPELKKRVNLLGAVSHEKVNSLMMASDILFLPSEWEGIALAIYEGMSMGLAIVGADVGGQRELCQKDGKTIEKCAFLIPHNITIQQSISEYVSIFEKLFENPELIAEMGNTARKQIVENFDIKQMGECMVEAFYEAAEKRRGKQIPASDNTIVTELATWAVEFIKMQEGK